MTGPSFPSIAPSQVAGAPRESPLAGFGEFFAMLLQQRQQIAQQREQLALERQRTEASVKAAGTQDAAAKLEIKQRLEAMDRTDAELAAKDFVEEAYARTVMAPGGINEGNLNAARVRLVQEGKSLGMPLHTLLGAFDARVNQNQELAANIVQRRSNVVAADVAEATKADVIEQRKLGTENARLAIEVNRQQKAMNALALAFPGERTSQALSAWQQSGEPYGKFRKMYGLRSIEGGIGDTEVFAGGSGAAGGAAQRTAEATGTQILLANTLINKAAAKPTLWTKLRISSGQGTFGRVLDEMLAAGSSPEQQQLAQGALMFGAAFGRWVSGQASSEREAQRLANIIIEPSSADRATRAQYRAVRESITQIIVQSAAGQLTPTMAADLVVEQLGQLQLSPKQRAELEKIKVDAARYERTGKLVGTPNPRDSIVPKSQAEIQLQGYGITIAPKAP